MEDLPPPPSPKFRLKPKENFVRANSAPGTRTASGDHDVFAWRQQEQTLVHRAGTDEITPVRRSHRRTIDYWATLVMGNLVFGLIGFWGRDNLFILACSGAGSLIFTLGLTWIMWGIMRRY